MKAWVFALFLCFAAGVFGQPGAAALGLGAAQPSASGLYLVSFAPSLEPLAINQMHSWVLRITDAQGVALANASIEVSGGMPAHDHGLPTAPRVTAYLEDGRYLLEGMKFHMAGAWELVVDIKAAPGKDFIVLPLTL